MDDIYEGDGASAITHGGFSQYLRRLVALTIFSDLIPIVATSVFLWE